MDSFPNDLIPLPTMPYDERPASMPLDIEECRTALWKHRGNVTEAAALLKIQPSRLRKFITTSKRLQEEVKEAQEQLVDLAEDVIFEALTDDSEGAESRRDSMARFVATNLGGSRGYGNGTGKGGVSVNLPGRGRMEIVWGDGSGVTEPNTIEHEAAE